MGIQTVFQNYDRSSGERELVDMIKALHGEGLHVMLNLGGQPNVTSQHIIAGALGA